MKALFLLSLLTIGSLPTWNGCNSKQTLCELPPDPRYFPPAEREEYGTAECELRIKLPAQMRLDDQEQAVLYIKNLGTDPVTLVAPGDGSIAGWRTPTLHWSFLPSDSWDSHSAATALGINGRCGNINSLEPEEVFQLAPGEEKELASWLLFTDNVKPGNYRVRLYYNNIPDMEWEGLTMGHDPKAMQRVKNSTPVSLLSNEVEVEVLPPVPVPAAQ